MMRIKSVDLVYASEIKSYVKNPKDFILEETRKLSLEKKDPVRKAKLELLKELKCLEFDYLLGKKLREEISVVELENRFRDALQPLIKSEIEKIKAKKIKEPDSDNKLQIFIRNLENELIPKRVKIICDEKDRIHILKYARNKLFMNRDVGPGICARPDFVVVEKRVEEHEETEIAIPYEVRTYCSPEKFSHRTYPDHCQLAADRLAMIKSKKILGYKVKVPYEGRIFYIDGEEKTVRIDKALDRKIPQIAYEIKKLRHSK